MTADTWAARAAELHANGGRKASSRARYWERQDIAAGSQNGGALGKHRGASAGEPARPYLDTSSLSEWRRSKPQPRDVARAVAGLLRSVPRQWTGAMRHLGAIRNDAPQWLACLEALDGLRAFENEHGQAQRWNMGDAEICALADKLAGEAGELDAIEQGRGATLPERIDAMRMLVRVAGIEEPKAITGEAAIKRAQDARWWRRALRVHVARVVEAGAIKLGIVNRRSGGYASNAAVDRRAQQVARNAAQLNKTLYRNEAGQVFTLAELAAKSTANPTIRGGELMTRIRGAEEYADAAGHVGLFVTLTCPSRMHAVTAGRGGRPQPNPRYDGTSTPRTSQRWLRDTWARTRSKLARDGVKLYGLRVAEPHHDATPHWHALLWVETEAAAQALESTVRAQWLRDDGNEPGAVRNRVNVKRMTAGGAAGYVAKYIAKSVGHHALADALDVAQGELMTVDTGDVPGFRRVDAWAATWGIRQFQAVGMPPVSVWRELRRVGPDQAQHARVAWGDGVAWRAWLAAGAAWPVRDVNETYTVTLERPADWCGYMRAMGGHAQKRSAWRLRVARRQVAAGQVNAYGEPVRAGVAVGVECSHGRWLISRRQAWRRVVDEAAQEPASRAALAAPWTGFNNCTARLTGRLRAALLGLRAAGPGGGGGELVT